VLNYWKKNNLDEYCSDIDCDESNLLNNNLLNSNSLNRKRILILDNESKNELNTDNKDERFRHLDKKSKKATFLRF